MGDASTLRLVRKDDPRSKPGFIRPHRRDVHTEYTAYLSRAADHSGHDACEECRFLSLEVEARDVFSLDRSVDENKPGVGVPRGHLPHSIDHQETHRDHDVRPLGGESQV